MSLAIFSGWPTLASTGDLMAKQSRSMIRARPARIARTEMRSRGRLSCGTSSIEALWGQPSGFSPPTTRVASVGSTHRTPPHRSAPPICRTTAAAVGRPDVAAGPFRRCLRWRRWLAHDAGGAPRWCSDAPDAGTGTLPVRSWKPGSHCTLGHDRVRRGHIAGKRSTVGKGVGQEGRYSMEGHGHDFETNRSRRCLGLDEGRERGAIEMTEQTCGNSSCSLRSAPSANQASCTTSSVYYLGHSSFETVAVIEPFAQQIRSNAECD